MMSEEQHVEYVNALAARHEGEQRELRQQLANALVRAATAEQHVEDIGDANEDLQHRIDRLSRWIAERVTT